MKNLFRPADHARMQDRLRSLRPDSPRQWGRMSPHEAVCHLSDSFRAVLGDLPMKKKPPTGKIRFLRFMAFTSPMPWPKGKVKTSAQVDPQLDGTRPDDFERDVADLFELMDRFVATNGALEPHYHWGEMSRGAWGRYGYRHMDHHLTQFGC